VTTWTTTTFRRSVAEGKCDCAPTPQPMYPHCCFLSSPRSYLDGSHLANTIIISTQLV
jgi:hypothetical protein